MSVRNFINKYLRNFSYRGSKQPIEFYKPPFLISLLWLTSISNDQLKEHNLNNIIGGTANLEDFIKKMFLNSEKSMIKVDDKGDHYFSCVNEKKYFDRYLKPFNQKLTLSNIDRRKFEAISLDKSQQRHSKYIELSDNHLVSFRGRGGTGKTIILLSLANKIQNQMGVRCLFLTYNRALVCDYKRILTHSGITANIGSPGIQPTTFHKLFWEWLVELEISFEKKNTYPNIKIFLNYFWMRSKVILKESDKLNPYMQLLILTMFLLMKLKTVLRSKEI